MKRISTVMQRRDGNDDWLTKHWKWQEFASGYVRNFQHFNWTQGVGEASRPVPDAFSKARAEIEHLRDLVERVLDPEPAGFGPMPARASDAARDEALTEEARAIQSGLIALAKEAEEFSSVLDLARENREPVPLSQWRVVRPAFNIESVYPKTGSRWVLVLGGNMIDPDDLKRLTRAGRR